MPDDEIYQEFIIELYKNPMNFGSVEGATHKAEVHNPTCGDMIVLTIKVVDGKIVEAMHSGKGCAISQASASLLTEYLKGKQIEEVLELGKKDILDMIKINLSRNPTRIRCALLPLDALKKALKG
jgi:nitrogen fixation NifU-like protein